MFTYSELDVLGLQGVFGVRGIIILLCMQQRLEWKLRLQIAVTLCAHDTFHLCLDSSSTTYEHKQSASTI